MDNLKLSEKFMYYSGLLVVSQGADIVDDLKHISDLLEAEEQGLLIKLPCKVGDTVYALDYIIECDCDYDCIEFSAYMCEENIPCDHEYRKYYVKQIMFRKEMMAVLGKTVFLTKEEAEKALKEKGE